MFCLLSFIVTKSFIIHQIVRGLYFHRVRMKLNPILLWKYNYLYRQSSCLWGLLRRFRNQM